MAAPPTRASLAGTLLAATGALSYGLTIVFNRDLAKAQLGPATALGVRFTIAALALFVLLAALHRPVLPVPGERVRCLALGALYGLESLCFFAALERGTAAAVTLLFYSYPAVVTVVEVVSGRDRLTRRVAGALGLSVVGSVIVVLAGAHVSITTAGIVLALCAAAAFSTYLIVSDRVLGVSDAMTTGAWTAFGAGLTHLARGAVTTSFVSPSGHWPALLGNAAATAAAFSLLFAALRLLGPARTAVVMTLEAVWGIALAAVFLDEALRPVQLLGGAAVLAGAVVVAAGGHGHPVADLAPEAAEPP